MRDGREHTRVPLTVEMRFRTASSFLVAYSQNLSRGGVFIETEHLLPIGTRLSLRFGIGPGNETFQVEGSVTWTRARTDTQEPGMGVGFKTIDEALGAEIDRLVKEFTGVNIAIFSPDKSERSALGRLVRSIVSTATLHEAGDSDSFADVLTAKTDLAVIDTDVPDGEGWLALRMAQQHTPPVPVIALVGDSDRERAAELGATEVAPSPPVLSELQPLLVRALGRPSIVE